MNEQLMTYSELRFFLNYWEDRYDELVFNQQCHRRNGIKVDMTIVNCNLRAVAKRVNALSLERVERRGI
jgi:hypothetical protein